MGRVYSCIMLSRDRGQTAFDLHLLYHCQAPCHVLIRYIRSETTPTANLSLNGSNPELLPEFVQVARENVGSYTRLYTLAR